MIIEDQHTASRGKILIADDDLFYRRLLANFLTGEKYSVTSVQSSDEARHQLLSEIFDMCVFDYNLPGESLAAIVSFMKRSARYIPFIIITGDESCDTERDARGLGPVFFFIKPFSLSDFSSVIREGIGRSGSTVAARSEWSIQHE